MLDLAKDVAEWIEHKKPSEMLEIIDDDEKLKAIVSLSGQGREMWFLSENGLYEVLMQSRKPIAKQFKKKVKEILKSIRKHGAYITDEVLDKLIEQQPKVDMYDAVMDDNGLLNFIQVAGLFGECGRNSLMKILRESKI